MEKQCFKCKVIKSLESFYKHPQMPDGRVGKCKECNKIDVRKHYANNIEQKKEYDTYRNRHSVSRLLSSRYSGIKSRCTKPRSNGKKYSVNGTIFLTKDEWLKWCYEPNNYKKFIEIYNNWVQSDFKEKLSPSIDRIDNSLGYIVSNLQWLTKSENCSKYNK